MHLESCLNPKLIKDSKGIQTYVPCGQCAACLRKRSMQWIQRLEQERYCWKYAIFFTLTYAPANRPYLRHQNGLLIDIHHRLTPPLDDVVTLDIDECIYKYSKDFSRDKDWLSRMGFDIPCLSSYDLQKFIKRLRINFIREYEKRNRKQSTYKENEKPSFRYFAIGEYGETLLSPHYHGIIFTSSEFIASNFASILDKTWKLGITNFSFVSASNAHYVAQYLNCTAHLPSVYRDIKTRPFFLCSKFPPIGTMCHSSKEVKEMFFQCSPEQVIFNHKKSLFDNVPLWRTYIDRLYPKLSAFNDLSHHDRVILYRLTETKKLSSFSAFRKYVLGNGEIRLTLIDDYVNYFKLNCDNLDAALQRWFYISSRVCRQAQSFEISVNEYVSFIEKFYDNCDKKKIALQQDFKEEFSSSISLVGLDRLFIESLCNLDVKDVSLEDLTLLSSYGVDLDKFFADDLFERVKYQQSLLPQNSLDYEALTLDSESWLRNNMKTKIKNEYLNLHPDYKKFIY